MGMSAGARSTLSLRQTVFLTLGLMFASVALGAGVLFAFNLRQAARAAVGLRVDAVIETLAPQVAALADNSSDGELRAWCHRQLSQQNLLLVGVSRAGHPPIVADRKLPDLRERLAEVFMRSAPAGVETFSARVGEHGAIDVICVRRVIPAADRDPLVLMLAMAAPPGGAVSTTALYMFVLPMLGVSLTGLALGYWWLHRHVLGPLDLLSRLARNPAAMSGGKTPKRLTRGDQIGGIARALQYLHNDLETWRTRVQDLEKQVERRVQAKTESMSRQLKRISHQVRVDPLTRLYNRRFLDERLNELFDEHSAGEQDLSVVMIDLDNFKVLNDQAGHAAGDDMLRFVAALLRDCTRGSDFAARYGGDEFSLILAGTNAESAERLASRIIALFSQRANLMPVSPKPSLSAGVASMRVHRPASADELLQMADAALYAAKNAGKCLVQLYDPRTCSMSVVGLKAMT